MEIYFQEGTKYLKVHGGDTFLIRYEDARLIYRQMHPTYIENFTASKEIVSSGLERYMRDHSILMDALSTDWDSAGYILARLISDVFIGFQKGGRAVRKEHTRSEWEARLLQYNYACAYCCATGVSLQKDHVVPVSRGGDDKISNIVPACAGCNRSKHDKTIDEWLKASKTFLPEDSQLL